MGASTMRHAGRRLAELLGAASLRSAAGNRHASWSYGVAARPENPTCSAACRRPPAHHRPQIRLRGGDTGRNGARAGLIVLLLPVAAAAAVRRCCRHGPPPSCITQLLPCAIRRQLRLYSLLNRLQERLKMLKKQHGNAVLGQVTVEQVSGSRFRLGKLGGRAHCRLVVYNRFVYAPIASAAHHCHAPMQAVGGMRGIPVSPPASRAGLQGACCLRPHTAAAWTAGNVQRSSTRVVRRTSCLPRFLGPDPFQLCRVGAGAAVGDVAAGCGGGHPLQGLLHPRAAGKRVQQGRLL